MGMGFCNHNLRNEPFAGNGNVVFPYNTAPHVVEALTVSPEGSIQDNKALNDSYRESPLSYNFQFRMF